MFGRNPWSEEGPQGPTGLWVYGLTSEKVGASEQKTQKLEPLAWELGVPTTESVALPGGIT